MTYVYLSLMCTKLYVQKQKLTFQLIREAELLGSYYLSK